jgi:hypothetical protein
MVAIGQLQYFLVSNVKNKNMDETALPETPPEAPPEPPKLKKSKKTEKKVGETSDNGSLLFFASLLETKKQLDKESKTARISNLSIV